MSEVPSLSNKQKMILSHIFTSVIHDPAKVLDALENMPQRLRELGASDEDVEAIANYSAHLETHVKDNDKVGYW